jgi:5-methylcytosine-specific restriction endonuclease McrA
MALSKRLRVLVLERDNFTCQYCGRRAPEVVLEVDHYEAQALGGDDETRNLRTACRDCNGGKSDMEMWHSEASRIRVTHFLSEMRAEGQ